MLKSVLWLSGNSTLTSKTYYGTLNKFLERDVELFTYTKKYGRDIIYEATL